MAAALQRTSDAVVRGRATVAVPSAGAGRGRRDVSSDTPGAPGVSRGFAAAWCVLLATMGRVDGRAGVAVPLLRGALLISFRRPSPICSLEVR